MNINVREVHASLLSMIRTVRRIKQDTLLRYSSSQVSTDEEQPVVWWVLICGDALDPCSPERRDKVRERLRDVVASHGIALKEHVWVWDSTGIAQVVAGEFDSRDAAEAYAGTLREKGLKVRVRAELR